MKNLENKYFNYLVIILLTILYAPLLWHWYDGWLNKTISIEHEYFSHGIIGLPFASYICWEKRKSWEKLVDKFHPLGGVLVAIAIVFYLTGVAELVNLSFPIILIGIVLYLKSIPGLKLQFFPLLLVILATPNSLPYLITPWSLPLQKFIAVTAGFILTHFQIDVAVEGIYLFVGQKIVEVAPYCAGLKMLFTGLYVGLMLLYWTNNHREKKVVIIFLLGTVFISIGANILRNTMLAFFYGTGKENFFGWLHNGWGGDFYSTLMLGTIAIFLKIII